MSSVFFLLSLWPDRITKGALSQNHIGLIWLNHIFQHGHPFQKIDFTGVLCCGKNLGICASVQDHSDPPKQQRKHPTLWELMPDVGMVQAKVVSEHIQVNLSHSTQQNSADRLSEHGEKQQRASENTTTVHVSSSWSWIFSLAFGSLFYRLW